MNKSSATCSLLLLLLGDLWPSYLFPSHLQTAKGFPGGAEVKNPPVNAGDTGLILGGEDPLEEQRASHSSILAWKLPPTEGPGELQPIGSQRARRDCAHMPTQTAKKELTLVRLTGSGKVSQCLMIHFFPHLALELRAGSEYLHVQFAVRISREQSHKRLPPFQVYRSNAKTSKMEKKN